MTSTGSMDWGCALVPTSKRCHNFGAAALQLMQAKIVAHLRSSTSFPSSVLRREGRERWAAGGSWMVV